MFREIYDYYPTPFTLSKSIISMWYVHIIWAERAVHFIHKMSLKSLNFESVCHTSTSNCKNKLNVENIEAKTCLLLKYNIMKFNFLYIFLISMVIFSNSLSLHLYAKYKKNYKIIFYFKLGIFFFTTRKQWLSMSSQLKINSNTSVYFSLCNIFHWFSQWLTSF